MGTPNSDIPDFKILNDTQHEAGREDALREFMVEELAVTNPTILEVKPCRNTETPIMWVTCDQRTVREAYYGITRNKNKEIKLIQYFPRIIWKRKEALLKNLTGYRKNNPGVKTKIGLGKFDLQAFTQHGNKQWQNIPMMYIDESSHVY